MLSSELDEHVELMDRVLVFREHELFREIARGRRCRGRRFCRLLRRGRRCRCMRPTAIWLVGDSDRRSLGTALLRLLNRYSFGFALLLTLALLAATLIRDTNFGWRDQLANFAPMALAAMASTPAIISGGGGFDLSISPLMYLSGEVFIVWLAPHGLGGAVSVPIILAVGIGDRRAQRPADHPPARTAGRRRRSSHVLRAASASTSGSRPIPSTWARTGSTSCARLGRDGRPDPRRRVHARLPARWSGRRSG